MFGEREKRERHGSETNLSRGVLVARLSSHLLLVIVTVVVDAIVKAMTRHHPLLLHQALEATPGPTVGVTHHLHQAGHHTAHVPVLRFCKITTGREHDGRHQTWSWVGGWCG